MISETSAPQVTQTRPSGVGDSSVPSFIELSDDEILGWLSLSILDEQDASLTENSTLDASADEFWEQVARTEAELGNLGLVGEDAVTRAIGLVGVGLSLGDNLDSTLLSIGGPQSALGETLTDPSRILGSPQLAAVQAELVTRAQKAVAIWASLQGSALRAASNERG